jgi:hypothetical protein
VRLEDSQFYLLRAPESYRCRCEYAKSGVTVREEISCPLDPGHARIGRFYSNLNVVIPCSPPADFLFTWVSQCLLQEHVIDVMERAGLTGFWTKPAKAVLKKTGESVTVSQLGVIGWGGIVPSQSGIRMDESCPGCGWTHWSDLTNPEHLIQPQNWDGSDFFIIWPMPAYVFVSERVFRVYNESGFKGARFSKTFPVQGNGIGFSPQRLSQFMPKERAHEIGDSLGIF